MNINAFLESLAANNSRNFKIDQLNANSDNEVLREVVRLALDPFTNFYIRKIPSYTQDKHITSLENALNGLYDLSSRSVTGNAAIEYLRMLLSSLSVDDAKVLERVIQKDLKCGVSISTANDVWHGLVKEYPVMLCSPFEQKLVDKVVFPALVQTKMDGMRFNAIVKNGAVEFRSRNGKEIQLLGNLEQEFLQLSGGIDVVFDGELLVKENGKILDRQTGNGILNKANKNTIAPEEAAKVVAVVWDFIPYPDFVNGICKITYENRYNALWETLKSQDQDKISLIKTWVVGSYDEAQVIFKQLLSEGEEGIILKDKDSIWEDKRSKGQVKFKAVLDADVLCVGVEAGTGKYAGMIGSLLCETSDGIIKVSVGSGLTDEDRKKPAEEYIGKIIAINYNARITNKTGEQSLFLPIYLETREDKTIANSSDELV